MWSGASGWHNNGGGGGGGTITGGGTLNRIAKFTPIGTSIGDSQIFDDGVNVGVGTLTPVKKFSVLGESRFEPVATVINDITGSTVNTTNATSTTIQSVAIPTGTGLLIEARVTCRKTSGAGAGTTGDVNGYIRIVKAKNVAGVVTIGAINSSFTSEDIGVFNATFAVSGTNVNINVVGSANNNVTWNVIVRTNPV